MKGGGRGRTLIIQTVCIPLSEYSLRRIEQIPNTNHFRYDSLAGEF